MRTVICHFYNESYLLPWWLNHHKNIFDHGIMINHKSTDSSVEIIKNITPAWDIVETSLTMFDAFMTDLEVMNIERQVSGFKIALNVTEFLMPAIPLIEIEQFLLNNGRVGCAASGIICVDHNPAEIPVYEKPLVAQKYWGYDDNLIVDQQARVNAGLSSRPFRNRFYHSGEVGMYHPGRHSSWHQDSQLRINDLMIFHYGYAPWNESFKARKLQIKDKIPLSDLAKGFGDLHFKTRDEFELEFDKKIPLSSNLYEHHLAKIALKNWC